MTLSSVTWAPSQLTVVFRVFFFLAVFSGSGSWIRFCDSDPVEAQLSVRVGFGVSSWSGTDRQFRPGTSVGRFWRSGTDRQESR